MVVEGQSREGEKMERLFDREPDHVERRDRRVTMDWVVGETPGREGTKRHLVTYTVRYALGGMNYFSGGTIPRGYAGGLTYETEERGEVFTSRGFMLGNGLGGIFRQDANRYSAKQFQAALPVALERLREVQDDPRVQAVIADALDGLARAQEQVA